MRTVVKLQLTNYNKPVNGNTDLNDLTRDQVFEALYLLSKRYKLAEKIRKKYSNGGRIQNQITDDEYESFVNEYITKTMITYDYHLMAHGDEEARKRVLALEANGFEFEHKEKDLSTLKTLYGYLKSSCHKTMIKKLQREFMCKKRDRVEVSIYTPLKRTSEDTGVLLDTLANKDKDILHGVGNRIYNYIKKHDADFHSSPKMKYYFGKNPVFDISDIFVLYWIEGWSLDGIHYKTKIGLHYLKMGLDRVEFLMKEFGRKELDSDEYRESA